MNTELPHITICVCTYRRPELLRRLLESLHVQHAADAFSLSVVVADNDAVESSKDLVFAFAEKAKFPVVYCVEPVRNIALARNKALEQARGDFIAFIDDDEFPAKEWLAKLLQTCERYNAAGVLGPVKPHFEVIPPTWIVKGGFCNRPEHTTGAILEWWQGRTGNVLFRRKIVEGDPEAFRPEFGTGGEDQDFYMRMMERGHQFVWCNEAVVYETVSPSRWKRTYMLKRALLRGRNSLKHRERRHTIICKSFVAAPLYFVSLPISLLGGHHRFMKHCVKMCDHLGRILTLAGLNPVHERQM